MSAQSSGATVIPITPCERCRQLEERAAMLQLERDELFLAVARERERANAILLEFPNPPQIVQVHAAAAGPAPLRHRVVDRLNDSVKALLPFAHVAVKRLLAKG
jgi:hypothetical protein